MRSLFFFIILLPQLCQAIDLPTIEHWVQEEGYKKDAAFLDKATYYSATKRLDKHTSLSVQVFYESTANRVLHQIRIGASRCPGSSFSDAQFRDQAKASIQKLLSSFFGSALPEKILVEMKMLNLKGAQLNLPGVKSLRTKTAQLYCDATPGGYGLYLDVFLE